MCGRTYCHEHKWAATYLAMPYRRDLIPVPTVQELGAIAGQLSSAERRLQAWRRTSRRAMNGVA